MPLSAVEHILAHIVEYLKTFDLGVDIKNIDHLFFNFFPGRDLHAAERCR